MINYLTKAKRADSQDTSSITFKLFLIKLFF